MGTAVILVDHGSRRKESNRAFEAFVDRFAGEAEYKIVEPAHMELAEPSIAQAFERCVERGATDIVVCPFFLLPGRHWSEDIPRLAAEASSAYGGIAFMVSAPIGGHSLLVQLLSDRIQHCQRRVAGQEEGCDVCQGEGGCVASLVEDV